MLTPKIFTTWLRAEAGEVAVERPAKNFSETARAIAESNEPVDQTLAKCQFVVTAIAMIPVCAMFMSLTLWNPQATLVPFDYHSPARTTATRTAAPATQAPVYPAPPSVRPAQPNLTTFDSWLLEGAVEMGDTSRLEALQAARNARNLKIPARSKSKTSDLCIHQLPERSKKPSEVPANHGVRSPIAGLGGCLHALAID